MSGNIRLRKAGPVGPAVEGASLPAPPSGDLRPGDRIEISVSGEVRVKGDLVWVKYGVSSAIAEGETALEAHERVMAFQQRQFEQTVYRTVEMIEKVGD